MSAIRDLVTISKSLQSVNSTKSEGLKSMNGKDDPSNERSGKIETRVIEHTGL